MRSCSAVLASAGRVGDIVDVNSDEAVRKLPLLGFRQD